MEKDRNIKKLSVIALVVSILGLSIVFALLSVSLNVTGVAKINKSGLDVIFEKIPGVSVSKSKMVVLTYDEPEITDKGKTLNLGKITLSEKGDYYQYSINVVNRSKYYAKITSLDAPNVTAQAYKYIDISFKYENGVTVGIDDVYAPSQRKKVIIKIMLRDTLTDEEYDNIPDDFLCDFNDITVSFEKTDVKNVTPEKNMTNSGTLAANVVAQDLSSVKFYGQNSPLTNELMNKANGYRVTFMDKNEAYEYATDSFDGSEEQNKSVTVSYVLSQDNYYDVYIGSDGGVYAPSDSSMLFTGASAITNLNYLDTSKVTDMSGMFFNSSVKSLDLSSFDTSNVTDMSSMFDRCSSLTNLDLSKFNTLKVENFSSMFSGCSSLESLDMRNVTFDAVVSNDAFQNIFYNIQDDTLITVKTDKIKSDLEDMYSNLTNIVVAGQ